MTFWVKEIRSYLMGGNREGPTIARGPLYFVLLFSAVVVSYFIGKSQVPYQPQSPSEKVFGVSTVSAAPSAFEVTNVEAIVDSPQKFGCIYGQFNFTGKITSSGPGLVTYTWEGNDNSLTTPIVLAFENSETKEVTTSWQVYGAGPRWIKLHVYSPNEVSSEQIPFELTCR